MGCGCDRRAKWVQAHTGIPVELQHLAVALALGVVGALLSLGVALAVIEVMT